MKTQASKRHTLSGQVLIVAMVVVGVVGVTLAGYMRLVSHENRMMARSQSWNSALPYVEAGVEEMLSHLYHNYNTGLAVDGWVTGNNVHTKARQFGDVKVFMAISNTTPPIVYSMAKVPAPISRDSYIYRQVKVDTRRDSLFARGLVAKEQITLNGNNIMVDSFDSSNTNYSTATGYYDPAKNKDGGTVATNSDIISALNTGNADIYGTVSTGPGGTVDIGPNGAVGDFAWHSSNSGIQTGAFTDDMNVAFPDVVLPFSSGYAPPNSSSHQCYITTSGDYAISYLYDSVLVASNVHARLLVTQSINLTGTDRITIQDGGSLQIIMKGTSAKLSGNGIVNENARAASFQYWGLPTNTELTITGNGTLIGVIYAPSATLDLNGSGKGLDDIIGASVTKTAKLNGSFNFHYDEALADDFKKGPFIVTDWNEL